MFKVKKNIFILVLFFICNPLAYSKKSRQDVLKIYKKNIKYAYQNGFIYALVPWLKEYTFLAKGNTSEIERYLESAVLKTGAKNFEGLNLNLLEKSRGNTFKYISARKLFSKGQYKRAKQKFLSVSSRSAFYPMAQNYLAVISYLTKKYEESLQLYEVCKEVSLSAMGKSKAGTYKYKQYKVNKDICIAGKARVYYAQKKYDKADLSYLDLDKGSIAWPPILLEEAWSSYYRENYNRTLGKLVTYNAPLLQYFVNPEIYILRAMSLLRLCLYEDLDRVVNDYYEKFEKTANSLEKLLKRYTRNKLFYYNLVENYERQNDKELRLAYKGIRKLPSVEGFFENIENAEKERKKLSSLNSNLKKYLLSNISDFIRSQKSVIGIVAKAKLQKFSHDLRQTFQSMSYMRLEVLGRKKEAIYNNSPLLGKRGDIKYLKRNAKQYFWSFNSEFWSDELGDYVFTLPSECPDEN